MFISAFSNLLHKFLQKQWCVQETKKWHFLKYNQNTLGSADGHYKAKWYSLLVLCPNEYLILILECGISVKLSIIYTGNLQGSCKFRKTIWQSNTNNKPPSWPQDSLITLGTCINSSCTLWSVSESLGTLWTVARQAPLSMGFLRQEYWSGLPFPPPGNLLHPGIKPASPTLAGGIFTSSPIDSVYNAKYSPLLAMILSTEEELIHFIPPMTAESLLIVLVRGSLSSLVPEWSTLKDKKEGNGVT